MRIEKCNTKSACDILHEKPTTTDHHHGIKQRKFNTPLKQHKTLGWILPTTTFEPLLGNLDVCKRQGLHHVQELWHALTTSYKPRSLCFFWEIYSVLSCPFICFCAIQSLSFWFHLIQASCHVILLQPFPGRCMNPCFFHLTHAYFHLFFFSLSPEKMKNDALLHKVRGFKIKLQCRKFVSFGHNLV